MSDPQRPERQAQRQEPQERLIPRDASTPPPVVGDLRGRRDVYRIPGGEATIYAVGGFRYAARTDGGDKTTIRWYDHDGQRVRFELTVLRGRPGGDGDVYTYTERHPGRAEVRGTGSSERAAIGNRPLPTIHRERIAVPAGASDGAERPRHERGAPRAPEPSRDAPPTTERPRDARPAREQAQPAQRRDGERVRP